jgi:hypothetical protein
VRLAKTDSWILKNEQIEEMKTLLIKTTIVKVILFEQLLEICLDANAELKSLDLFSSITTQNKLIQKGIVFFHHMRLSFVVIHQKESRFSHMIERMCIVIFIEWFLRISHAKTA